MSNFTPRRSSANEQNLKEGRDCEKFFYDQLKKRYDQNTNKIFWLNDDNESMNLYDIIRFDTVANIVHLYEIEGKDIAHLSKVKYNYDTNGQGDKNFLELHISNKDFLSYKGEYIREKVKNLTGKILTDQEFSNAKLVMFSKNSRRDYEFHVNIEDSVSNFYAKGFRGNIINKRLHEKITERNLEEVEKFISIPLNEIEIYDYIK